MKKTMKHIHAHLVKHQYKYIGLAAFCKVIVLGLLAIPMIQMIQNIHAQVSQTYTITANASDGGIITPSGMVTVNEGAEQTFTFKATTAGYQLTDVIVDKVSVGTPSSYTFSKVMNDHSIQAVFGVATYTITTKPGDGGTISPAGPVTVNQGDSQTFDIIANEGYGIKNVDVDGVTAGMVRSYTFKDVVKSHSIGADFGVLPVQQTAYVDCNKDKVGESPMLFIPFDKEITSFSPESNVTINDIPAAITGYGTEIAIDLGSELTDGDYNVIIHAGTVISKGLLTSQDITIPFTMDCTPSYDITIKIMSESGTTDPVGEDKPADLIRTGVIIIDPGRINDGDKTAGTIEEETPLSEKILSVNGGSDQLIRFLPAAGYTRDKVIVDDLSTIVGAQNITFANISTGHTIAVYFKAAPTTTTTTSSNGGGGGGTSLSRDYCPNGDYSASYYDKDCGYKPATTATITTSAKIPAQCYTDSAYFTKNIITCVGLQGEANLLKTINDRLVQKLSKNSSSKTKITINSDTSLWLTLLLAKRNLINMNNIIGKLGYSTIHSSAEEGSGSLKEAPGGGNGSDDTVRECLPAPDDANYQPIEVEEVNYPQTMLCLPDITNETFGEDLLSELPDIE